MTETHIYQIRIRNVLDESWSDWFEGLTVRVLPDNTTLLKGLLADQSALFGILGKIHDLNLHLISVQEVVVSHKLKAITDAEAERNQVSAGETIEETYSVLQALTIQSLLRNAGIQASLVRQPESQGQSGASDTRVKIIVPKEQLYQAKQLLTAVPRRGEIFCVPEDIDLDAE